MLLKDIGDLRAEGNFILANRVGIYAEGVPSQPARQAVVARNVIAGNEVGLALQSNAALTVTDNRISDNLTDVRALGRRLSSSMRWSEDGRGNSWSQYRGYDADRNGIGDVPHRVEDAMDALMRRNPHGAGISLYARASGARRRRTNVPVVPAGTAARRPPSSDVGVCPGGAMIRDRDVSKRYGRRTALSNVSLDLGPGEIALLLGANGAGKSTLLRCLLGMTDYEGSIAVAGLDPLRQGCAVRSLIGYMPQSGGLHPDLTVDDTVRLYAEIRRVSGDRGATLLEEAGLSNIGRPEWAICPAGMRQRLGFVLALLTDPPILILDEPSASLDAASRAWLAARLRAMAQEGRTVLVSTHAGQELLDVAGPRIVLEDGRCTERPAAIAPADGGLWRRSPDLPRAELRALLLVKEDQGRNRQSLARRLRRPPWRCWDLPRPRPASTAVRASRCRRSAAPRRR